VQIDFGSFDAAMLRVIQEKYNPKSQSLQFTIVYANIEKKRYFSKLRRRFEFK